MRNNIPIASFFPLSLAITGRADALLYVISAKPALPPTSNGLARFFVSATNGLQKKSIGIICLRIRNIYWLQFELRGISVKENIHSLENNFVIKERTNELSIAN